MGFASTRPCDLGSEHGACATEFVFVDMSSLPIRPPERAIPRHLIDSGIGTSQPKDYGDCVPGYLRRGWRFVRGARDVSSPSAASARGQSGNLSRPVPLFSAWRTAGLRATPPARPPDPSCKWSVPAAPPGWPRRPPCSRWPCKSVAEQISRLSQAFELMPGDII